MVHKDTEKNVDWIYMAHETSQWRALVTMLFTNRLQKRRGISGLVARIFPKGICFLERMPGKSNRQKSCSCVTRIITGHSVIVMTAHKLSPQPIVSNTICQFCVFM
jgi:hypothetical protein